MLETSSTRLYQNKVTIRWGYQLPSVTMVFQTRHMIKVVRKEVMFSRTCSDLHINMNAMVTNDKTVLCFSVIHWVVPRPHPVVDSLNILLPCITYTMFGDGSWTLHGSWQNFICDHTLIIFRQLHPVIAYL